MRPIWKYSPGYTTVRLFVNLCTRMSYNRLNVAGVENIPTDGAVILAPNHCNTLMDAFVVAQAKRGSTLFAVRADIFRKPSVARILRWLRMVPLSRERDGLQEVSHNYQIFDEVVDALRHDLPFCIFSEGTHRAKRSLLPLKKGIFRIATKAARASDKPVYIVPMGLEYEDYYNYMKHASVRYGIPINITEYLKKHPDATEGETFAALSISLHDRISSLITYFPDDENYEANLARWEASRRPVKHWWEWVAAPFLLPFFLVFGLLSLPIWLTSSVLIGKLKDKTWSNTVRCGCKIGMLPLLLIAFGIPAFILLPWYAALTILLSVLVSHSLFYLILNLYTKLFTK